jgi:chromosome segregation ATPase
MGIKDYSSDIEKLRTENAVLQSNVDNLKKENMAYEAKNRTLESDRSVLSDSVDVLNDKIEKIKKDHGKKNGNIDNLDNAQLIDYFSKHLSKTN